MEKMEWHGTIMIQRYTKPSLKKQREFIQWLKSWILNRFLILYYYSSFRMIIILLPTFTSLKENIFLVRHLNLRAQKKNKKNSKPHQTKMQKNTLLWINISPTQGMFEDDDFPAFPRWDMWSFPGGNPNPGPIRPLHCWPGMPGAVESNNSKYLGWDRTQRQESGFLWCPFSPPSWNQPMLKKMRNKLDRESPKEKNVWKNHE